MQSIYLDSTNGLDTNSGTSWAQAYKTIEKALTSVGNEAFSGGKFNQISIPELLSNVGNNAFGSNRITSVITCSLTLRLTR